MTVKERRGLRITLIRMDMLMDDIHRIWSTVPSSYVVPKRRLGEARSVLVSDSKRACRLISKARREIIEESKAAQEYNRFRNIIPQIDDPIVRDLDRRYNGSLEKGDYKTARNIAIKLSRSDAVIFARHSVTTRLTTLDMTSLTYTIENNSVEDITVRVFRVTGIQRELESDTRYPFIIRRNSKMNVIFKHGGIVSDTVQVYMEYTEGGIVKTHSFETVTSNGL